MAIKSIISGIIGLLLIALTGILLNKPDQTAALMPECQTTAEISNKTELAQHAPSKISMPPSPVADVSNIGTVDAAISKETENEKITAEVVKVREAEKVAKILSDLQAVSYTSSLHEIETNNDWLQLSPEAQQQVMIEIVRRVNSGEIPKSFIFPGK